MVVEAASQRLGGCRHDVSESGHDVGNPYTCGKRALVNSPAYIGTKLALLRFYDTLDISN